MSDPRVAHCAFCDDVRLEVGNKMSLMGMYHGDMIVGGRPPLTLPKLVIVVWVLSDIGDPIQKMTTIVQGPPNQTEILRAEVDGILASPAHLFEDSKKLIAQQIFTISPFIVTEAGVIDVLLETDRGSFRAGRLRVSFADPEVTPGLFGTTPPTA